MRAALAARPWLVLVPVLGAASALILVAGEGLAFSGDELFYYARVVGFGEPPLDGISLDYLLVPHNGHFQLGGKLVYEAMLAVFGVDYLPYRVLELVLILTCVVLFYLLARRRVGDPVALLGATLLAFLGPRGRCSCGRSTCTRSPRSWRASGLSWPWTGNGAPLTGSHARCSWSRSR